MLAPLPPSSRLMRLPVPAIGPGDLLADLGRAGERDLVDVRVLDDGAAGFPCPRQDVDDSRREVGLLADLREEQRSERCRLGGLEDHGVAAGERGCDLPGEHEEREVPRDDLTDDTDRSRVGPEAGIAQLVRPARVVEEVCCRKGNVDVAGLADRLAVVDGLEDGELARALLQDARDAEEVLPALGARHLRPRLVVRAPRSLDRPVDVTRPSGRDLREDLLVGRVDRLERRTVQRVDEGAVDEQAVGRLDLDDGA